ncbi:hypothetical protein NQ318_002498 [Aromia moschata]|uniref:Uncharacterized protein n=1 Tax=Aromia moschata TaxID=1265417 RepID=A0AAV8Y8N0_9CUCU|nr:hypothetical protein NQ318_002498 [Aromia moschata]
MKLNRQSQCPQSEKTSTISQQMLVQAPLGTQGKFAMGSSDDSDNKETQNGEERYTNSRPSYCRNT